MGGAGAVVGQATHGAMAKTSLTLDNTRWNVRVTVTRAPKYAKASNFHDVLVFRTGTVSGQTLQKQGLDMTPYTTDKVKGHKTELQWKCEQIDPVGDKYIWQGTATPRRQGLWKMKGTIVKTTADGQIYQFRLRGSGHPFTPETPEFTSSGK
jgi:hypothetical protein